MVEAAVTVLIAAFSGLGILHTRHMARMHELDRRVDAIEVKMAEKYVTKDCFETTYQIQNGNVERLSDKFDEKLDQVMINMRPR